MKKIILSFALLLCMCVGAIAQTKVLYNNGPIGLDWKFKRSFVQGTTLVVDFTVTNNTGRDLTEFRPYRSGFDEQGKSIGVVAYDDEGNMYSGDYQPNQIGFSFANQYDYNPISLPTGNMIKARVQIKGIDEFATQITTFISPILIPALGPNSWSVLRVTNIPIPRE